MYQLFADPTRELAEVVARLEHGCCSRLPGSRGHRVPGDGSATRATLTTVVATSQRFLCRSLALPRTSSPGRTRGRSVWGSRSRLRAWTTTSCPSLSSVCAAARPRPSAEPVMKTRAILAEVRGRPGSGYAGFVGHRLLVNINTTRARPWGNVGGRGHRRVRGPYGSFPDRHLPVCGGAAGSCTVTRSPPAGRGVRVRVPSCAWVMLLTIARPRPTPAWSVRMRSVPR